MLPKNKPVAELKAIQKLIETYKDTLNCVLKDDGYYFTAKNKDSGFYFWVKSISISFNVDIVGTATYQRGLEIKQFLEQNDCESYLIIDDHDDFLPEQQSRFVKCDSRKGF